ncbi:hypothetical protein AMTRI_Chr03g140430 [Amborella trichopoda]
MREKLGFAGMEKENKNHRACRPPETDFLLQWGNRKRMRCIKIQTKEGVADKDGLSKKTTIRVDRRVVRADKESAPSRPSLSWKPNSLHHQPNRLQRNSDTATLRSAGAEAMARRRSDERLVLLESSDMAAKGRSTSGAGAGGAPSSSSPEKEDRYSTRGAATGFASSTDAGGNNGKICSENGDGFTEKAFVWPKFIIALSSKEKEEDFMAMKGCKLPPRPKKRAKFIQKSLLLVSPGAWLCELSQERYEVREKKSNKKRPRGLKAMGNMESDSE